MTDKTTNSNEYMQKHGLLFILIVIFLFPLYIHFNPVRWEAFAYNFSATFLIFRPYIFYGHWKEYSILLWIWFAGYGLGRMLLDRFSSVEKQPFYFTIPTGWGILGLLFFALTLLHQISTLKIAGTLTFLTLIILFYLLKTREPGSFRYFSPLAWKTYLKELPWDIRIAIILISISVFSALISGLIPPKESDGLRYHLTVPKLYLEHGGFYLIPGIAFSNFPFLIEYLFMIPLAFGSICGPNLIHSSYFIFTIGLIYCLGKRLHGTKTGYYAALLFATTPFLPLFSSWAFIECGLTCYTLLGFILLLYLLDSNVESSAGASSIMPASILIGLMAGFIVSCKYTALSILFYFSCAPLVYAIFCKRSQWKIYFRAGCIIGFIGITIASPWFIKNWILLGNPIYPFAKSLFPSPYWTDFNAFFFTFHAGMKGNLNVLHQLPWWDHIIDFITLPFRITLYPGDPRLHPETFGEWPVGSLWLALLPFLFFIKEWNTRKISHLVFAFFLFVSWAYSYRDTRFLIPTFAVIAPLYGLALENLIRSWKWSWFVTVILILYGIAEYSFRLYIPGTYGPWWVASGVVSEERYLTEWNESLRITNRAFQYLRENTVHDDLVLLHGVDKPFYCPNRFIGADWFNTDPLIEWSWKFPDASALLTQIKSQGIKYIVYDYGNIHQYNTLGSLYFYRLFRLPPETGLPLLREVYQKEAAKVNYPLVYEAWTTTYEAKLADAEAKSPNIKALEQVLQGGSFKEVFRYQPKQDKPWDGVVIYKVEG